MARGTAFDLEHPSNLQGIDSHPRKEIQLFAFGRVLTFSVLGMAHVYLPKLVEDGINIA